MNIKPIAYTWRGSDNTASRDLKPGTGVGGLKGVFLTTNPYQFLGDNYYKNLFGVLLTGLEEKLIIYPEKKWMVVEDSVPAENISHIYQKQGIKYEDELLKENLIRFKEKIKNHKRFRSFKPEKIYKKFNT